MKKNYLILFLIFFCCFIFAQQNSTNDRGLRAVVQSLDPNAPVGKQYALIIAIDRYSEWLPLRNPVKDAKEIQQILDENYYIDRFFTLYDEQATRVNILRQFQELINLIQPNDSLFIFYAGHGHLDALTNTGFWIPVDGGNDQFAQVNWIGNNQIRGMIGNIKSKHILLVSDSCFSGDLLNAHRGIVPSINNEYFKRSYSLTSRQILTSGSSEAVPDSSEFAMQLKMFLRNSNNPIVDPLMIFSDIRTGMSQTTPMFGSIAGSGHQEGASFLLFRKTSDEPQQTDNNEYLQRLNAIDINTTNKIRLESVISQLRSLLSDIAGKNLTEIERRALSMVSTVEQKIKEIYRTEIIDQLSRINTRAATVAELQNALRQVGVIASAARENGLNDILESTQRMEQEIKRNIEIMGADVSVAIDTTNETAYDHFTADIPDLDPLLLQYNMNTDAFRVLSGESFKRATLSFVDNSVVNRVDVVELYKSIIDVVAIRNLSIEKRVPDVADYCDNKLNDMKTSFINLSKTMFNSIDGKTISSLEIVERYLKSINTLQAILGRCEVDMLYISSDLTEAMETLNLNKRMLLVEQNWTQRLPSRVPLIAAGSACITIGGIATILTSGFWIGNAISRQDYYDYKDDFLQNTSGDPEFIDNAILANNLFYAAIGTLVTAGVFSIAGIILLALIPNRRLFDMRINNIKSRLQQLDISFNDMEFNFKSDTIGIGLSFDINY